jgi:hypothetical protein
MLTFPYSPTVGDTTATGGRTWKWNGSGWVPIVLVVGDDVGGVGPGRYSVLSGESALLFDTDTTSLPSGWAWRNQGSAAWQQILGKGVLTIPSGSTNLRMIERNVPPDSSWVAITRFTITGAALNIGGGMGLWRDANNSGFRFVRVNNSANTLVQWFTAPSTYSGDTAFQNIPSDATVGVYLAIRKNSATSWDFLVSPNGVTWATILGAYNVQTNLTAAPDKVFLFGDTNTGGNGSVDFDFFVICSTLPGLVVE